MALKMQGMQVHGANSALYSCAFLLGRPFFYYFCLFCLFAFASLPVSMTRLWLVGRPQFLVGFVCLSVISVAKWLLPHALMHSTELRVCSTSNSHGRAALSCHNFINRSINQSINQSFIHSFHLISFHFILFYFILFLFFSSYFNQNIKVTFSNTVASSILYEEKNHLS